MPRNPRRKYRTPPTVRGVVVTFIGGGPLDGAVLQLELDSPPDVVVLPVRSLDSGNNHVYRGVDDRPGVYGYWGVTTE